jgi:hypothetical protein
MRFHTALLRFIVVLLSIYQFAIFQAVFALKTGPVTHRIDAGSFAAPRQFDVGAIYLQLSLNLLRCPFPNWSVTTGFVSNSGNRCELL